MNRTFHTLLVLSTLAGSAAHSNAQFAYQKPSKAVLDTIHAPQIPQVSLDPTRTFLVQTTSLRYPAIANLSQPMLRLAGVRINPKTSGPHRFQGLEAMILKEIASGKERNIELPVKEGFVGSPSWSPDGKRFAFTVTKADRVELWTGDPISGRTKRLIKHPLGSAMGQPFQWAGDSKTLVVQLIPEKRGKAPDENATPSGPRVEESKGARSGVRTFEDLLQTENDEKLFDYHATVQLARVDAGSGRVERAGTPSIFSSLDASPDGKYCIATRVKRPYSHLVPVAQFPRTTEVLGPQGESLKEISTTGAPNESQAPAPNPNPNPENEQGPGRGGAGQGGGFGRYRSLQWKPGEPHTLMWIETKTGGTGDHVVTQDAPYKEPAKELIASEGRIGSISFGEKDNLVLISEGGGFGGFGGGQGGPPPGGGGGGLQGRGQGGGSKTYARWLGSSQSVALYGGSREKGQESGTPITKTLPNGSRAVLQDGMAIYLSGSIREGAQSKLFVDRIDTRTAARQRLFETDPEKPETLVALVEANGPKIMTRRESENEPPNYYVRAISTGGAAAGGTQEDGSGHSVTAEPARGVPFRAGAPEAITKFADPTPLLRSIAKKVVTYKRADGVQCSFTLYLPPNHKEGTRLPTLIWAYPREFSDADAASQITNTDDRFTTINGLSHLTMLLEGYAILDNASMPIVGSPRTVNDTFIEQLVMDAKAAIDKAVELGVTDPDRVAVGGHSYGAFMTANLLAHSDLFRAGIARSGAYNRTLTPFGFQNERRTFWQARDTYNKMSPFFFADKLDEPILLVHGEADNNPGTFPIQSERLYQALRGNGGTVRLVMLPAESHGYTARESVEHVQWETIEWLNKYVKNAPPREKKPEGEAKP